MIDARTEGMVVPKKALAHRVRPPEAGRATVRAHRRARLDNGYLGVAHGETDRAVKTRNPDEIIAGDTRF